MKPLLFFLLVSFSAKAQVFKKGDSAILVKPLLKLGDKAIPTTAKDMMLIPANTPLPIPPIIWKTTESKDTISDAWIVLKKTNGETITIVDAWRFNIRRNANKIAVAFPDSSKVIYQVRSDTAQQMVTIPLKVSKETFDNAESIKLEIIR